MYIISVLQYKLIYTTSGSYYIFELWEEIIEIIKNVIKIYRSKKSGI